VNLHEVAWKAFALDTITIDTNQPYFRLVSPPTSCRLADRVAILAQRLQLWSRSLLTF